MMTNDVYSFAHIESSGVPEIDPLLINTLHEQFSNGHESMGRWI